MAGATAAATEGVAVIGLAGRFPGAPDIESYWRNLRDGVESIRPLTEEELRRAGVGAAELADPRYVRVAAPIEGAEEFDAAFFGYSPRDARRLDPQQRLFLQAAWGALEHAGCDAREFGGTIGVWASSTLSRYLLDHVLAAGEHLEDLATLMGNDKDYVASRTSYHLGLTGPSVVVQTACSSSLVAVALACQALDGHQCDLALAGGVAVRLPQHRGYQHVPEGILSPDGHCRPFDASARGTVFGSGLGVVVLKRLADALADGDTIHAVVRGAAVNNDGDQKLGFTAPSVERQAAVVAMAHAVAGLDSRSIGFVEAHGTATPLGDPVEVAALTQAFRVGGARPGQCALGSVKGNVGHLDVAAGIASFIKTVLALEHAQIPPTLHFECPNPQLELERGPFFVNSELRAWRTDGAPRRAGVSSFGMGGTNAHVVLEQAPPPAPTMISRPQQLIVLSARTPAALDAATAGLAAHLRREADLPLPDVAYTLQTGRRAFEHRRAFVVGRDAPSRELLATLTGASALQGHPGTARPGVAFLFPGQGAQHVGMGAELYATERVVREHVDHCCELLRPHLGLDLRELLFPPPAAADECAARLTRTDMAQPALFVIEYALARLWMEWGVQPQTMLGHSIGEYVAACLTQVFRLEHALQLVALRGRLMQSLPAGAMLAVPLAPDEIQPLLGAELALAAINAPRLCTVSGPLPAIEALAAQLGAGCRRLAVSHAFHSPMMEPILPAFSEAVRRVPRKPPEKAFVSSLTGTWITPEQALDPAYWARQLRETVRFADGLALLRDQPGRVLLEVGPGTMLATLAGDGASNAACVVSSMRHPQDERSAAAALVEALGRLWVAGVPVDWRGFSKHERRRRVPLPTYPFERARHWIERGATAGRHSTRALVRSDDPARWYHTPSWKRAASAPPAPRPPAGTRWLVLADAGGFWEPLLQRLRADGQELIVARPGGALGPDVPSRILHLALGAPKELEPRAAVSQGHTCLVQLAETLAARGAEHVQLTVVVRRAHDVTGEVPSPERATILGACRVLPQEHPALHLRLVDVDVAAGAVATDADVARLHAELMRSADEPLVALRGGHRWLPQLEPLVLERPDDEPALRARSTWLVTGGLGGIGLTLARFLAEHCQARLVLTSRRALPPRESWKELAAAGANGGTDVLRRLLELEALGAEVLVVQADVTSRPDMRRALQAARARFGKIDGVIHAAGLSAEGLGRAPGAPLSEAPLGAKIEGTQILAELCGDEPALIVLCSSLSTAMGGLGQAAYVAGNSWMDAFAAARRGGRTRWLSIGWDTWGEVGMGVAAAVPEYLRERKQQILRDGLTCAEGVDAFRRVVASPHVHVYVSTIPLDQRLAAYAAPAEPAAPAPARESQLAPVSHAPAAPRAAPAEPAAPAPPAPPADEIEAAVTRVWTQLLGIQHATAEDSFFEQGGNSLLATQMLARLRERFADAEISLASLFARPTIAGLVAQIRKTHGAPAAAAAGPAPAPAQVNGQLRDKLRTATGDARHALLVDWLGGQVAEALGVARGALPAGGDLDGLDRTLIAAHLSMTLRRDLSLALYAPEIRPHGSLDALARLIESELSRAAEPPTATATAAPRAQAAQAATTARPTAAAASVAFLLSSPRSGSTLLRLMLSAHPKLFCPPELFLLDHETMRAWSTDPFAAFYRDGLVRAVMGRRELGFDAALALVEELVARDAPTREVYSLLTESNGSMLVDKTPTYALDTQALARAETLFEAPRYIGLVRHPYAVIESIVRNRLDRIRRLQGDPHDVAESTWVEANRNLLELGRRMGARFHLVRYEQLVQSPEAVLRELCGFLGVAFDAAVLDPYARGRMFGGPGDPNLHGRGAVDARLGETWRGVRLPRPLGAEAGRLAASLSYELPA
jgi:phthiocerol/phenolphthiocerol synthesis type-I polyketide synthase E